MGYTGISLFFRESCECSYWPLHGARADRSRLGLPFEVVFVYQSGGMAVICILGENKGEDQLRNNCKADQRLCFRYSDSTIPLLSKSKISSF